MSSRGFTVMEMLVSMALTLLLAGAVAGVMAAAARASLVQPQLADEQQRLRAALEQITGWLGSAGRGLGGIGPNEGWILVPPLYPQRRGFNRPDADTSAFSDRITIVAGLDPPATTRLASSMSTPAAPLLLDLASCGPGRVACGLTPGTSVLIADARASGEWFIVADRLGSSIDHAPGRLGAAYSTSGAAVMTGVEVRSLVYDRVARQIRSVGPLNDLPFIDEVAEFSLRWFGDPRPPRGPIPPGGEANCTVAVDGSPRLPPLAVTGGAWVELSPASLSDGPWCGVPPWRFDADLFRVRLLRVGLRLDRAPSGPASSRALPSAVIDLAPRNLMRMR